jgi:chemotaxis response regulator CheB
VHSSSRRQRLAFLKSATRFLAMDKRLEAVGFVVPVTEALELVSLLCPDLVLIDLAMPEMIRASF